MSGETTYPCPAKIADISLTCLDQSFVLGLAEPLKTMAVIVQGFQELMDVPTEYRLPNFIDIDPAYCCIDEVVYHSGFPPVDPLNPQPGEFYGILGYLEMMLGTGYLVKQIRRADTHELWPMPPDTREEVIMLQECDAFWISLDEMAACMGLDARDLSTTCMTYKMWNTLFQLISCAANYACGPGCNCIYCGTIFGCQPCTSCMTLQVGYGGAYWVLKELPAKETPPEDEELCVQNFSMGAEPFRDASGIEVPGLSLSAEIYLVKSYVIWKLTVYDTRSTNITATMQPEMYYTGLEGPSKLCQDIPESGSMLFDATASLYRYEEENTSHYTNLVTSLQIGFPICHRPWSGIRRYYAITMGGVPVCGSCEDYPEPPPNPPAETDGRLIAGGGGLVLETVPASHGGKDFDAEVTFDSGVCAYRLIIRCDGHSIWEGLKLFGCGGPEGSYITDSELAAPCFSTTIEITIAS